MFISFFYHMVERKLQSWSWKRWRTILQWRAWLKIRMLIKTMEIRETYGRTEFDKSFLTIWWAKVEDEDKFSYMFLSLSKVYKPCNICFGKYEEVKSWRGQIEVTARGGQAKQSLCERESWTSISFSKISPYIPQ